ncbi:hypothetical protein APSETT444_009482 [Aspergillus pseudonomiae]
MNAGSDNVGLTGLEAMGKPIAEQSANKFPGKAQLDVYDIVEDSVPAGTEHSALGYVDLKTYEDASEDPNCTDRDLQIAFAFWVGMNLELKDLRGLVMKAVNLRMENT